MFIFYLATYGGILFLPLPVKPRRDGMPNDHLCSGVRQFVGISCEIATNGCAPILYGFSGGKRPFCVKKTSLNHGHWHDIE